MSTVVSLCDLSGAFVEPWVQDGHHAVLVDPQHGETRREGSVTKLAMTVEEALPRLARIPDVIFVAAFPPCTDMAVSGARWFAAKRERDAMFQAKAVAVAEQCRTYGRLSGAPWLVENPVSVLSSVFGRPDHTFHPHDYTGWEPADNYFKRTCLWAGGGFMMPPRDVARGLGEPDSRIHKAPPGPERANFRSVTPAGFARAVHAANSQVLAVSE